MALKYPTLSKYHFTLSQYHFSLSKYRSPSEIELSSRRENERNHNRKSRQGMIWVTGALRNYSEQVVKLGGLAVLRVYQTTFSFIRFVTDLMLVT
jgi:hypothetical protein